MVDRVLRYGHPETFEGGAYLYRFGERGFDFFLVLDMGPLTPWIMTEKAEIEPKACLQKAHTKREKRKSNLGRVKGRSSRRVSTVINSEIGLDISGSDTSLPPSGLPRSSWERERRTVL
jgi:hypothetical protein